MSNNSAKKYRFSAETLKPLAVGLGSCFASDMITVDGFKVGFLYRQQPEFEGDSGWRFLTGFESDEYLADVSRFNRFDVNVIANCDPEIVPLLSSPVDTAFGRDPSVDNRFVRIED